jgi:hypothetical protein
LFENWSPHYRPLQLLSWFKRTTKQDLPKQRRLKHTWKPAINEKEGCEYIALFKFDNEGNLLEKEGSKIVIAKDTGLSRDYFIFCIKELKDDNKSSYFLFSLNLSDSSVLGRLAYSINSSKEAWWF